MTVPATEAPGVVSAETETPLEVADGAEVGSEDAEATVIVFVTVDIVLTVWVGIPEVVPLIV